MLHSQVIVSKKITKSITNHVLRHKNERFITNLQTVLFFVYLRKAAPMFRKEKKFTRNDSESQQSSTYQTIKLVHSVVNLWLLCTD